jgi:hypothetical protein
MKRSLMEWASIAEIVSCVAVIVTLVFLIQGIQENTDVTASSYERSIEGLIEFEGLTVQYPELSDIWFAYITEGRERVSSLPGNGSEGG